jgi:spermidine/putrescine-binding protein
MKKKQMIGALLALSVLLGSMTACGGKISTTGGGSASTGGTSAAAGKGGLNLYVWTEYVPDSVIQNFEKQTGIQVNVSTYSTNEDMLAKVKSESEGAFDIVQPSDYMVEQMIKQGMLQKLDQSKLTNLKNISSVFLNQSYDPGNQYSVPYLGGVAGIAVNTSKIKDQITSYADLFNPKYKKSIVALDDYRAVLGMAARSLGMSMNETDGAKIAQIRTQALKLKDNIKLYDSDSPKSALIAGDCSLGFCWSGEIALAIKENPAIKIVFPKEGAYVFFDNWCITKGAKNAANANKFINYMMDAQTAKAVSDEFAYLQPNKAAVELLGGSYKNNPAENVPEDVIQKGEHVKNLDTATLAKYNAIWTELKK